MLRMLRSVAVGLVVLLLPVAAAELVVESVALYVRPAPATHTHLCTPPIRSTLILTAIRGSVYTLQLML
eukprot:COSAG02_NODE_20417_length_832_cov_4.444748_1_plen_68_part_01